MTFYRSNTEMDLILKNLLIKLEQQGRPNLRDKISITWICYPNNNPIAGSGVGANWCEEKLFYPASIVKLFYAVAIEAWLQKDLLIDSLELQRALNAMVKHSSNDATSLIIDLLTGTTSGPSLLGERWDTWQKQRQIINKWLKNFKWPEFERINCCQKTWGDAPYGREKDFYKKNANRNALTSAATARLLEEIMTSNIISPLASKRLQNLLSRSLDKNARKKDDQNQVDGFLGEGLSQSSKLWSKAGWMSQARHDAGWWCSSPNKTPMLLVVFSNGEQMANDTFLLPSISEELSKANPFTKIV